MLYEDTGIPVGQQRLQFGEGGQIPQESSPESTLGNWSHRDGWDNILLYRIQHAPKQDPGPRAHSDSENSPEPAPAPQHPTVQEPQPNVPDYIRNMDPIPIPDIVVIGHPNESWATRRARYQSMAQTLEDANQLLCDDIVRNTIAEAEVEYTTYIELLGEINKALRRKKSVRILDLDEMDEIRTTA
jgi:hypothetical protein